MRFLRQEGNKVGAVSRLGMMVLMGLGPVCVLGGAWQYLSAAPPWSPSEQVKQLDAQVIDKHPEVVVIGPSTARTDVDAKTFSQALGGAKVAVLAQNSAPAATWYAILKHRVYENGGQPKLVVLVATTPALLATEPLPEQMPGLSQHFAEPDAVLARKVYGVDRDPVWGKVLEKRSAVRDAMLAPARHALVGLFFDPVAAIENGKAITDAAAAEVFKTKLVAESNQRLLPVIEVDEPDAQLAGERQVLNPADALLPDIVDLAKKNGAKVIVV